MGYGTNETMNKDKADRVFIIALACLLLLTGRYGLADSYSHRAHYAEDGFAWDRSEVTFKFPFQDCEKTAHL